MIGERKSGNLIRIKYLARILNFVKNTRQRQSIRPNFVLIMSI